MHSGTHFHSWHGVDYMRLAFIEKPIMICIIMIVYLPIFGTEIATLFVL